MKNFRQLVKELPSNKVVVAFGAFQPPTSIHEHLVKAVKRVADASADYTIYASANEDKKHNPLSVDRKIYFLNRMFPGTKFQETKEQTIVGLAKKLNEKYRNLVVVVGEDKVSETEKQLNKANGKEFIFESIKVVSTGNTDPDSDLSSGVSGLRMCKSAKDGNFEDFKKGLPHTLTEHDSRRLMNEVRKGLGQDVIKEVVEFARSTVREQYVAGKIFNVGDKVQDDMGVYEIMDRGANYLTVVNESGELSKKWIDKVTAVEVIAEDIPGGYAPEEITFKGYTTKNLHHSADAAKAFQQTINKYEGGLIKDGVAILNALKHTDEYMKLNDTHLEQMKPPIASEVKSWVHAHMKVKESLDRIGEYLHHMDYWDNHGHELQMLMTNYKEEGDPTESLEQEGTMIKENDRQDPETKKVMLRYKDFLKKATTSEPPVEIGAESSAKKVDTKEKDDGRVTQSDQDSKIKQTEPKHVATGFSLTKPFDVNDTLRRQKVKYQLGESYDEAEKHLSLANDADSKGDKAAFHSHMADHHDALSEWHESKGRSASADKHAEKADYHHEKSLTVKEDIYTSDTKTKDYMTKDKEGNWIWRKRKIHPKRITFAASKMGGDPSQQDRQDEAYGVYRKGGSIGDKRDNYHPVYGQLVSKHDTAQSAHDKAKSLRSGLSSGEKKYYKMTYHSKPIKEHTNISEAADHEHPYNRPHDEPSVSHGKLKAGEHARAPYNRIVFGGALSKMWHAKNKSGQVKAFVNSDAAKKHALSEEYEINEGRADDLGHKIDNSGSDENAKSIISKAPTKHLQYLHHWNMGLSGARTHKDMPHIKAELTKRGAMLSAKESEKHFSEEVEEFIVVDFTDAELNEVKKVPYTPPNEDWKQHKKVMSKSGAHIGTVYIRPKTGLVGRLGTHQAHYHPEGQNSDKYDNKHHERDDTHTNTSDAVKAIKHMHKEHKAAAKREMDRTTKMYKAIPEEVEGLNEMDKEQPGYDPRGYEDKPSFTQKERKKAGAAWEKIDKKLGIPKRTGVESKTNMISDLTKHLNYHLQKAKVKKEEVEIDESAYPTDKTKTYGSWILRQKSMISKTPAEKSKKKVTKGKTNIADKETFDPKNAGGSPPFDPFFSR